LIRSERGLIGACIGFLIGSVAGVFVFQDVCCVGKVGGEANRNSKVKVTSTMSLTSVLRFILSSLL
jgi:gas vesicle protein